MGSYDVESESQRRERRDVVRRATKSIKWAGLSQILPRFISPASTLVLAALLTPSDFGIVAVSSLVIALAEVIVGLGLGAAIVQQKTKVNSAASVAFFLNLTIAIGLYGLLWIGAPWLSSVYDMFMVDEVIRVSGLSLIFFGLGSVPVALLRRDFGFDKLFWVETVPQVVAPALSAALAFLDCGVWALVLGQLVRTALRATLALVLLRWRPSLEFGFDVIIPLLGFSFWMVLSGVQSWLFLRADNAIAAYFLGDEGLGVFSLGFSVSSLVPGLLIPAVSRVAYPAFCALRGGEREVGDSLVKLQSLVASVVFPVCFGISAFAVPAVDLAYGEKWHGLGTVIQLLAIMPGIGQLWSLNADAYRSVGRPDVWAKLSALSLLVLMPALLMAGPYGFSAFVLARFGGAFAYPLLNILFTKRVFGISVLDQLKVFGPSFVPALIMFAVAYSLVRVVAPFTGVLGWFKLTMIALASGFVYVTLLWAFDRDLVIRLLSVGRQALSEA